MKSKCQCCDAPGEQIVTKSKLKKSISFHLCPVCSTGNHEPRFWIILFGRANGVRCIEKPVKNALYCGNEILLRELL